MNPASLFSAAPAIVKRLIVIFAALTTLNLQADAPPTNVRMQNTGLDTEGARTFRIEWDAVSNATYHVQRAGSLMPSTSWENMDLIRPVGGTGFLEIKGRSIPENSVEFFRLVLPQPAISAVEPAVFQSDVAVTVYVIGQCFESNDVVRVDGVVIGSVIYLSGGLLECVLPPQSIGSHVVELVRGGVVVSAFTVTNTGTAPTGALQTLQGPPQAPPAAPAKYSDHVGARPAPREALLGLRAGGGDPKDDDCNGDYSPSALTAVQCNFFAEGDKVQICHRTSSAKKPYTIIRTSTAGCRGAGSAVEPFSGEVCLQVVDLAIEGRGLDFVWARTYHSRIGRSGTTANGWTFSYDVHVQLLGSDFVIHDGTGRADTFKLNTNGVYTCPEFFSEGTLTGGVFRLTFADTGYWEFNPIDATSPDAKLARIVDSNGNMISLNYDDLGHLSQLVDDLGRTNTVAYDTFGRVANVMDFSGRITRYEYDGNGDLVACISPVVVGTPNGNDFPNGKTNRYTYSSGYADERENHLLLSVIDGNGQTTQQHVYQHNQTDLNFLRCIFLQRWTNTPACFTYLPQTAAPSNDFAVMRCIVNDPVGNVTECFYDARNRCVHMEEFAGQATPGIPVTATVNRPAGKRRQEDPDGRSIWWRWNHDSLGTLEILPGGQQAQFIYESDFDKSTPPRKRADLRVLRELPCCINPLDPDQDDDGVADLTERVWRFEYDPRFGSDPASQGTKLIREIEYAKFSAKLRISKGKGAFPAARIITDRDSGRSKGFGFITSTTDARGNVSTAEYDASGNCIRAARDNHLQGGVDVITALRFSYNTHGQLTAITNAADTNVRYFWSQVVYGDDPFTASYGKPVQVIEDAASDGLALTTSYEYDLWGNISRIVDPLGNDCKFHNNALNQIVRDESPTNITARCATDYFYDANDNLVQCVTELRNDTDTKVGNNSTFYEYDPLHRLLAMAEQVSLGQFVTNRFEYDANDNLTAVLSPEAVNGNDPHNVVTFQYDDRGLLFRETSAPGSPDQSTAQYDYDNSGNLTRVSDGLEGVPQVTTMEYDGFAGFGSSSQTQGKGRRFLTDIVRYRSLQMQRSVVAGFGEVEYSLMRADCQSKEGCGNSLQFAGRSKGGDGPLYGVSLPHRLGAGLRAQGTTPLAGAARIVTFGDRWASCRSQSEGKIKKKVYNVLVECLVSKITDPMGNQTTFAFDANDNLKLVRHFGQTNDVPGTNGNIRLTESRYEYDGLDQLVRSRDALFNVFTQAPIGDGESTTTFAYAPNGACTSVTDDLSRVTRFTYDTAGRLASVIDPKTNVVSYAYDAACNIVSVTSTERSDLLPAPQVFTVTSGYDKLHRLTRSVDNVGNTNRYAYDSRGNLVSLVTPRLDETFCVYDGLNRCITTTNYVGLGRGITINASHVEYDSNSRCVTSTDSNGNVTQYTYDSRNRVVLFGGMDGTSCSLVWSPRSNLVREQDANGTVVSNSYDALDRCVRSDIFPGAGVAPTTTFETFIYDGLSRLIMASNDVSQVESSYDSMSNKEKAKQDCIAAVASFDSVGNCLSLTYPGGTIMTYTYNALDEVTSVSRSAGGLPPVTLATFSYEGPGRVGRITRTNGINTRVTWNGMANPANATGDFGWQQVSGVNHQIALGGAVIDQRRYSYDRNQNKTLRAQLTPFIGDTGMTTNIFEYDALDQMRLAIKTKGTSAYRNDYTLDGNGNRVNVLVTDNGAAQLQEYTMSTTTPEPADFQMNQYTMTPFGSQQYDKNGNLIWRDDGDLAFVYDYANRLVNVGRMTSDGILEPVVSFTYDAFGRRISKTVYPPAPLTPLTTQFICGPDEDCDTILEERINGTATHVYCWGGDLVCRFTAAGQPQFYHTDDLGNVLALTDASTPVNVLERYDYDDYGMPHFLNADGSPSVGSDGQPVTSSALANPSLFHGMFWDSETGLYHVRVGVRVYSTGGTSYNNRYVDPKNGRYNSRSDEAGRGKSVYTFADENPWTAMKTGKVKFFNDAKGFGRMMKEEGGRHTPFQNKYRPGSLGRRQYTDRVILMNKQ
jgi:YD repeat-containing protein